MLKDNVDSIDETGNLPFDILKPVIKNVPWNSKLIVLCREYSRIIVILIIPQFAALGSQNGVKIYSTLTEECTIIV